MMDITCLEASIYLHYKEVQAATIIKSLFIGPEGGQKPPRFELSHSCVQALACHRDLLCIHESVELWALGQYACAGG